MNMPQAEFCDECGAALAPDAQRCSVCGNDLRISASSPGVVPDSSNPLLSPLPQTSQPLPSTQLTDRYRLLHEIGTGGFGVVYLAQDCRQRNRLVAIKQINLSRLRAHEVIEATDSYNREVSLLRGLKHAHLPQIFDSFTDSDHWYIVMSYINGETLDQTLLRKGALSVKQALKIGISLCDILHYLHTMRPPIVFRDVKPGNIMYTQQQEIYLIDFGIARRYSTSKTHDTGALGSPGYAAPEQYGRASTRPQTDIYGLGATLQSLLTGKEPLDLMANEQPEKYTRRVPGKLKPLLARMMATDIKQRPQRVTEVKEALEHFYANELFDQKLKNNVRPVWHLLRDKRLWQVLVLLLLIGGLLPTLFLLPFILLSLAVILGRSLAECRIELAWRSKFPPWRQVRSIVSTGTQQSLSMLCLLALYCYAAYLSSDSVWIAGYGLLFFIMIAICSGYFLYVCYTLINTWLKIKNGKPARQKIPPLLQQMPYRRW